MTLVAGVDVGNSTTEVVLVDTGSGAPEPVVWDSAPTRGVKGSIESLRGAAGVVRRLGRRAGREVDLVSMAPLRPVLTQVATRIEAAPVTGRLLVLRTGGSTPGGVGTAVGVPVDVFAAPPPSGPVILLAGHGSGYQMVAAKVGEWIEAGVDLRGVVLADDEAVLVSRRLPIPLPVADLVDVRQLSDALLVAVEVVAAGHRLQDLADPIRLSALLRLDVAERTDAVAVAETLGDVSHGVVALLVAPREASDEAMPTSSDGAKAHAYQTDLWTVALREVVTSVLARVDATTARAVVSARLGRVTEQTDPGREMSGLLGVEVRIVSSETAAGRVGALTTPGARDSATVVDLGGGTIDVIAPPGKGTEEVVVAGAGELLTIAVATLLGVPRGAADWIKRGPASRLEGPQVLVAEDGSRGFLSTPAAGSAVGSLVISGPAGLLPFGAGLAPAEWRALRLRTKERVLGDNLARAVGMLDVRPSGDVLLVGGAASDEELVGLLRPILAGAAVGRADVAGRLGHRYAVAYGLALLARVRPSEGQGPGSV